MIAQVSGETLGGAPPSGQVTLHLGNIERVRVSVARAEYLSVLAMAADAVAGISRGLPSPWCHRIAGALTEQGHRAIRPVGAAPSRGWVPDCLLPLAHAVDARFDGVLDVVRSADSDAVTANLEAEFGAAPPPAWRPATDNPRGWITACSDALTAAAVATRPLWRRARPLLDREIERVGVAAVRGGVPGLFATLNSRITLTGDSMVFSHPVSGTYDLAGRYLVLVPLVAGDRMLMTHFDDPHQAWIGYPVTGAGQLWQGAPDRACTDELAELLGPARAAIFRLTQHQCTMGALAAATGYQPATITFHCDRLQRAGLVEKHRQGRKVRVAHTELGTRLATAYEPSARSADTQPRSIT